MKHAAYHALSLVLTNLKEHAEHVYFAVLCEVKTVEAWQTWEAMGGKGGEKGHLGKKSKDEEANIKELKEFARCFHETILILTLTLMRIGVLPMKPSLQSEKRLKPTRI